MKIFYHKFHTKISNNEFFPNYGIHEIDNSYFVFMSDLTLRRSLFKVVTKSYFIFNR